MTGQEQFDLLIQVTAWAALTVYISWDHMMICKNVETLEKLKSLYSSGELYITQRHKVQTD
jgi:hypothetical protein